jgi:transposase
VLRVITARNAMANQMRGLLKLFGLRLGTARTPGRRADRLAALYRQRPDLEPLFAPLVAAIEAIEKQLHASNRLLEERAAADPVCQGDLARILEGKPRIGPRDAHTFLPGRDHEGSDRLLTKPSDDLEDNHWHREKE